MAGYEDAKQAAREEREQVRARLQALEATIQELKDRGEPPTPEQWDELITEIRGVYEPEPDTPA